MNPYPTLAAFDRGDELMLWCWTYRVWNGWRYPNPPLGLAWVTKLPESGRRRR
jgi:hypothetical protein